MSGRVRLRTYGSAVVLMVAGVVCSAVISGSTGEVIGIVLVSLGGVAAVSLVFYEVGLSEDRERSAMSRPAQDPSEGDRAGRAGRMRVAPLERHRTVGSDPASPASRAGGARRGTTRGRPPRRPH
jgi:hypothetical protein